MPAYYDIVLLLIPLVLAGISGSLWIAGLPLEAAIPTGSIPSLLLIAHALFVRGPVDITREPAA